MSQGAPPVRLAVWGLGRHALQRILPAVSSAPGVELAGVCSRAAATVAECAARWQCAGWTDPDAMLADARVDVVYVATPIGLHAEHGTRALEAGKHLWCEKPLTASLGDTVALLELSRRRERAVCEGFMYLHHPQFDQLRGYLAANRLGRLLSIDCRFGIPRLDHPGFRSNPALGGGTLLDVGCYPVSALLALFPGAGYTIEYARVFARDGSPVDTDGAATIQLVGGPLATLEWRANAAYRNEIAFWGENGSLATEMIFSKPIAYVPSFRFRDGRGAETIEAAPAGDHFVLMLQAFAAMLDDPAALESERGSIETRAALLGRLRNVDIQPL